MATSAGDRRSQEGFGSHVYHSVEDACLVFVNIRRAVLPIREVNVPGPGDGLIYACLRIVSRFIQEIPGEGFDDKLVVRQVGIEGSNQVVAISIGVGHRVVLLE